MRFPEDGMAAPSTVVRTAPGSDKGNRRSAVMTLPCVQILLHRDGFPAGPGLAVNVRNLCARRCPTNRAPLVQKRDATYLVQSFQASVLKDRQQFFESDFTFSRHDDVRT